MTNKVSAMISFIIATIIISTIIIYIVTTLFGQTGKYEEQQL